MSAYARPMGDTAPFFREGRFYPVQLSGSKTSLTEIPEHVELNPGTLRVADLNGNVLWPEGVKH